MKTELEPSTYVRSLGLHLGDTNIEPLLAALEVSQTQKLKRGEEIVNVSKKSLGVEVVFRLESTLPVSHKLYPEGALVLSNVSFYGQPKNGFSIFAGSLPLSLVFGASKKELHEKFGVPAWDDDDLGASRWDFDTGCLFADFEQNLLVVCAFQLSVSSCCKVLIGTYRPNGL